MAVTVPRERERLVGAGGPREHAEHGGEQDSYSEARRRVTGPLHRPLRVPERC
jgi:hypothetical protein